MDTPFDPTLEDDVKQLLTEVPLPVCAYLTSGKIQTVAKNLMQKNQLHIDQAAILEREMVLLLLGLKDSAEFIQALAQEARLDAQTVDSIIQDINEQIFRPLREEMRKGGAAVMAPAKPTVTAPPAATPPRASAPPAQVQTPNQMRPPTLPPPPVQPAPRPSIAPLPPKIVMPRPMLPLGEEPSASSPSINLISRPPQPVRSNTSRPSITSTPATLPGTNIPVPMQASRMAPPSSKAPVPIVKEYTSDPYREPIE